MKFVRPFLISCFFFSSIVRSGAPPQCLAEMLSIEVAVQGGGSGGGYQTDIPLYFSANDDLEVVAQSFIAREGLSDPQWLSAIVNEMVRVRDASSSTECVDQPAPPSRFYVEIGTSDFGTLHQKNFRNLQWGGLAVEPIAELLERLPLRPGLFVENAAVGCGEGGATRTIYRVDHETVKRLNLPRWALGTATFDLDVVRQYYAQYPGWMESLEATEVLCISWAELSEKHGLRARRSDSGGTTVDSIKVDAEGADINIIWAILEWYEAAEEAEEREYEGGKSGGEQLLQTTTTKSTRSVTGGAEEESDVAWPTQIRFEVAHAEETELQLLWARLATKGYVCGKVDQFDAECIRHAL